MRTNNSLFRDQALAHIYEKANKDTAEQYKEVLHYNDGKPFSMSPPFSGITSDVALAKAKEFYVKQEKIRREKQQVDAFLTRWCREHKHIPIGLLLPNIFNYVEDTRGYVVPDEFKNAPEMRIINKRLFKNSL